MELEQQISELDAETDLMFCKCAVAITRPVCTTPEVRLLEDYNLLWERMKAALDTVGHRPEIIKMMGDLEFLRKNYIYKMLH